MSQSDFSKLLDDLNDVSGRRFEQICRWFLLNDPIYGGQLKDVWLWDDWPDRWGRDKGIDLIAEDTEGRLWAIQAKHYAPDYSVTKADIDTFLSESNRPQIDFRQSRDGKYCRANVSSLHHRGIADRQFLSHQVNRWAKVNRRVCSGPRPTLPNIACAHYSMIPRSGWTATRRDGPLRLM